MVGRRETWLHFLRAVPVLGWVTRLLGRRLFEDTVSSFIVSYFSSVFDNLSPTSHSFLTCSPSPRIPINPSFCNEILYMQYILDQSCLHVMGHDDNVLTVRIAFLAQCGAFSYRVVKGGLCSTVRDLGVSCQLWDKCVYSLASWTPPCTIVTHLIEGLCSFLGTWKYLEMLNPFYNRWFARRWSQFAR